VRVALDVDPSKLNPVPVTEILEMTAFEFPVFLTVACRVSAVPTLTLPKFNFVVLEVSVTTDAWAVAVHGICFGDPGTLLVILIAPLTAPADAGFNAAVRFALCPTAIFRGIAIPETVMPEPVVLRLEIVSSESPEFVSRIVWVVVVPVGMVPKLTDEGVAVKAGATVVAPIPLRLIAVGESVAVLVTVMCSEKSPVAAGLKPAVSVAA